MRTTHLISIQQKQKIKTKIKTTLKRNIKKHIKFTKKKM